MEPITILGSRQFELTINRLCYQVIEEHDDMSNAAILGIQPRGTFLSDRITRGLNRILEKENILHGELDITFYRDDIRRKDDPLIPQSTNIDFSIEDKDVILVDDVLFTGRTIRAAMDAMLAFGRPRSVELLVLVDRRFSRHLPVQPDMTGITVDTIDRERVNVQWQESGEADKVLLYTPNEST